VLIPILISVMLKISRRSCWICTAKRSCKNPHFHRHGSDLWDHSDVVETVPKASNMGLYGMPPVEEKVVKTGSPTNLFKKPSEEISFIGEGQSPQPSLSLSPARQVLNSSSIIRHIIRRRWVGNAHERMNRARPQHWTSCRGNNSFARSKKPNKSWVLSKLVRDPSKTRNGKTVEESKCTLHRSCPSVAD